MSGFKKKKWEPQCEKRKTNSQSWPCALDEGHSLLEINCNLWIYRGVSNKLFWFSWSIYIVEE